MPCSYPSITSSAFSSATLTGGWPKPVPGSVRVAVAGSEVTEDTDFTIDTATGVVTFLPGHVPGMGEAVTAGFLFDVPVRFDTDYLEVDLSAFASGAIPKIPLVEIRP